MFTVLVCGGRDFKKYQFICRQLTLMAEDWPMECKIISGAASGVDEIAIDWAQEMRLPWQEFSADWTDLSHPDAVIRTRRDGTKYDALAGHRRNQKMLDEGKPDLVVAFPGGTGTADMVKRAIKAGVKVIEITE